MKIEVELRGGTFRADCKDLPGAPIVGRGRSAAEAVGNLMYYLARMDPQKLQELLQCQVRIDNIFKRADVINPPGGKV